MEWISTRWKGADIVRIGAINTNLYKPVANFGAKNLIERAQSAPNPEVFYQEQSKKAYEKIASKNKILVPIKLWFNKDYKELKKAQGFENVDFKRILTDLKIDRDYNLAIGENTIVSEKLGGALVDYVDRPPTSIPLGEIEEYDYSKTDLAHYARVLNNYVKNESILLEDKIKQLNAISTVGELVFKIERNNPQI